MAEKLYSRGLVVLSGGQNSTTVAAIAMDECDEVEAITFDYGQKASIESAVAVAKYLKIPHEVLKLPSNIWENSKSEKYPALQNLLFLTLAANRAFYRFINAIYVGINAVNHLERSDCRPAFISASDATINLGLYGEPEKLTIEVPLIAASSAETIQLALLSLGERRFYQLFELTHSCDREVKGGCGQCKACLNRDKGFKELGIEDPIWKHRSVNRLAL